MIETLSMTIFWTISLSDHESRPGEDSPVLHHWCSTSIRAAMSGKVHNTRGREVVQVGYGGQDMHHANVGVAYPG